MTHILNRKLYLNLSTHKYLHIYREIIFLYIYIHYMNFKLENPSLSKDLWLSERIGICERYISFKKRQ